MNIGNPTIFLTAMAAVLIFIYFNRYVQQRQERRREERQERHQEFLDQLLKKRTDNNENETDKNTPHES